MVPSEELNVVAGGLKLPAEGAPILLVTDESKLTASDELTVRCNPSGNEVSGICGCINHEGC